MRQHAGLLGAALATPLAWLTSDALAVSRAPTVLLASGKSVAETRVVGRLEAELQSAGYQVYKTDIAPDTTCAPHSAIGRSLESYGESAWVEQVVDFGHAKQIFPDADVFPCILVAQKPTAGLPPADVRVCSIPRKQLRIDDLSRQIKTDGVSEPRDRIAAGPWNL